MLRNSLISQIQTSAEKWATAYPGGLAVASKFRSLLELDRCFFRDCFPGHVTASAIVVDPDYKRVLLTHHAKLNRWLQLGGHCDGEESPKEVALREVCEESGLEKVVPVWEHILDVDIHLIPVHKNEPEHFHYDVRYVFAAEHPDSIQKTEESIELQWFTFSEARQLTEEVSLLRLFDKVEHLMLK